MQIQYEKKYIDVVEKRDKYGNITPIFIYWGSGRKVRIDGKPRDITRMANLKVGGRGLRYKVMINGKEHCLWLEEDFEEREKVIRWFIEVPKQIENIY